ncbi:MAG: group III truncated hemoglobin [Sulfuriferula sp.]
MQIGEPTPRRKLEPLCDKIGRDNVERVVHDFYGRLQADEMMGPFFANMGDFGAHESLIADYWWTVMGGKVDGPRPFDMLGKHQALNLHSAAFDTWLRIFEETLLTYLPPELAQRWLQMALGIGDTMKRHLGLQNN